MPMKNPPHPGDFIWKETIEPAGLTVTAAAAALQVSRPALSSLLNGKADLSGIWRSTLRKPLELRWTPSWECKPPTTSPKPASVRSKSMCGGFAFLWAYTAVPGLIAQDRNQDVLGKRSFFLRR